MNLSSLSDDQLVLRSQDLARREREILIQVLHHLREVARRRLFSALKKPSLLAFAVDVMGYSEPEALRRISAMRLLRDLPEVELEIASAALTLSNLVLVQTLYSKEKKAGRVCDRISVLRQVRGKSTREAQKIVFGISPEMKKRSFRLDDIEDEALRAKLVRLQGKFKIGELESLLHKLCDLALVEAAPSAPKVNSRAEVRRRVWRRDGPKCTNCGSTYALELDHIQPRAAGGADTEDNLRVLCRACNQRAARDYFGAAVMEGYFDHSMS